MYIGEKVKLRAYKEEDLDRVITFVNDFEIKKFIDVNISFPISKWEEEEWIKKKRKSEFIYDFAIEDLETNRIIGGCSINKLNYKNRNCTIGIMIGDKNYLGKGYGYDALILLINFIFLECNLEKIKLSVWDINKRAINCYKKIGFKEEGILKRELYKEGEYHDVILMALFKEDYLK